MARPRKIGLDYFPHMTDASGDEKIQILEARFGNDGYAAFFKSLEGIYKSGDVALNLADIEVLAIWAGRAHVTAERYIEILDFCVSKDLFDPLAWEDRILTSDHCKETARHVTRQRKSDDRKLNKTKLKETKLKERIASITCTINAGETVQETMQETAHEFVEYAPRIYLSNSEFGELYQALDMADKDLPFLLTEIKKASDWTLQKGRQHIDEAAFMRNWLRRARATFNRTNGNGHKSKPTTLQLNKQLLTEVLERERNERAKEA